MAWGVERLFLLSCNHVPSCLRRPSRSSDSIDRFPQHIQNHFCPRRKSIAFAKDKIRRRHDATWRNTMRRVATLTRATNRFLAHCRRPTRFPLIVVSQFDNFHAMIIFVAVEGNIYNNSKTWKYMIALCAVL